jgi:hypothetical protein
VLGFGILVLTGLFGVHGLRLFEFCAARLEACRLFTLVFYTLPIECKGMTADIIEKYFPTKPYNGIKCLYTLSGSVQGYIIVIIRNS